MPLSTLLERADVVVLTHGARAQYVLLRQIEAAIQAGEDPQKIQDLDHILQLVEFRQREPGHKTDGAWDPASAWRDGRAVPGAPL